jgi:hypothetical protein
MRSDNDVYSPDFESKMDSSFMSNIAKLAQLQEHPCLGAWSREFVNILAKRGNGRLTPKQRVALNNLCETYLKDNANATRKNAVLGQEHGAQYSQ